MARNDKKSKKKSRRKRRRHARRGHVEELEKLLWEAYVTIADLQRKIDELDTAGMELAGQRNKLREKLGELQALAAQPVSIISFRYNKELPDGSFEVHLSTSFQ